MELRRIIFIAVLTICLAGCSVDRKSEGSISSQMLEQFRDLGKTLPEDSAFLRKDLYSVVLDTAFASALDTVCTFRVPCGSITDQRKTGRCWLFSTLNIFRADMVKDYGLEDFEYSETYGQFYDILEKSNRWLENVIENRRRPMDSRMNSWLFKKPIGDGGHFVNAAHVISKYGAVPEEAMPEVFSSMDNARLMRTVSFLLRKWGMTLRSSGRKDIQQTKEEALSEIYHLLVQTLGTPPQEFSWKGETYTPQSFRDKFIRHDLENDYVILMNDPTRPYWKRYEVENSRNCFELDNWTFLNLPMEDLEDLGVKSLQDSTMFYFSCDTYHGDEESSGLYSDRLHDFRKVLGIDLSMSKKDLVASGEIVSVHAMAMAGVRLGPDGKPERWVAENSYGLQRGFGGFIVMDAGWFKTYLFRMAVEKRFLPDSLAVLSTAKPKIIPAWNLNY